MSKFSIINNGIFKSNPVFVLVLGMCPTLATTSSAINGMSMGLATTFVLILANLTISLIAGLIPAKVRIPSYIVVIASFVTVVDLLMQAYVPAIYAQLGIFIPLCVCGAALSVMYFKLMMGVGNVSKCFVGPQPLIIGYYYIYRRDNAVSLAPLPALFVCNSLSPVRFSECNDKFHLSGKDYKYLLSLHCYDARTTLVNVFSVNHVNRRVG